MPGTGMSLGAKPIDDTLVAAYNAFFDPVGHHGDFNLDGNLTANTLASTQVTAVGAGFPSEIDNLFVDSFTKNITGPFLINQTGNFQRRIHANSGINTALGQPIYGSGDAFLMSGFKVPSSASGYISGAAKVSGQFFGTTGNFTELNVTGSCNFGRFISGTGDLGVRETLYTKFLECQNAATFWNDVSFQTTVTVEGTVTTNGSLVAAGNISLDGEATINGDLIVNSSAIFAEDVTINGAVTYTNAISAAGPITGAGLITGQSFFGLRSGWIHSGSFINKLRVPQGLDAGPALTSNAFGLPGQIFVSGTRLYIASGTNQWGSIAISPYAVG